MTPPGSPQGAGQHHGTTGAPELSDPPSSRGAPVFQATVEGWDY